MAALFWNSVLTLLLCVLSEDRHAVNFPGVSRNGDSLILNEFVDSIIREMRLSPHLTDVFNPLRLERNISFPRGVLYDISVNGLLSLHRQGDITLVPDAPGLTARLAVNVIDVKFRYEMRTLGLLSQGRVSMSVNNIAMALKASLRDMKAQLDFFEINYFGKIRIHDFAGTSSMLNWLTRPTLEFFLNLSRSKLKKRIESSLREKLEDECRRVHLESVIASVIQQ